MQILHPVTMDMVRKLPMTPIRAVQNDANSRAVAARLLENGTPWVIPGNATAAVAFRKSDGSRGLYDRLPNGSAAISISGSTVTAVLAPQALTCPGEVAAALVFFDGSLNRVAAFPFSILVDSDPSAGQGISNDYYRFSTMEQMNEAVDAALDCLETEKQAFLTQAQKALAVVHDTATQDAPAIVCQAMGSVITVTDSGDRPLQGLSIYGKTTQNGTPTPAAPIPIESVGGRIGVTVTGKNILRVEDGTYIVESSENSIVNGLCTIKRPHQSTSNILLHQNFVAAKFTTRIPPGTYVMKIHDFQTNMTADLGAIYVSVELDDGATVDMVDGVPCTLTQWGKAKFVKCRNAVTWNAGDACSYRIQIVPGNAVPDAYEPYKEQAAMFSVPDDLHGTDAVKDEIDFARGVRITRFATVDLGTRNWAYSNGRMYTPDDSVLNDAQVKASGICTHFVVTDKNYTKLADNELVVFDTSLSSKARIAVNCSAYTDANAFKAALSGAILVYELAQPIETPLSAEELAQYAALHTNKPSTVVLSDAGAELGVAYVADTQTYIDQKLAAISAAILNG